MSYTTVVFPPPPPTHNTLTSSERSQLLRSNAKLGQLLGSTPHIVDEPYLLSRAPPPGIYSRGRRSTDSRRSTSSRSDSPQSVSSSEGSTSRSSHESHTSTASSASSTHSEKSWRVRFPARRPPMLLLGKVGGKPLLTVLGSPSYNKPLPPSPDSSSPQAPTFSIPSEASMRRQKMRRLAKKFGEGVPVHLVFPPTTESDDEDVVVDTPTSPVSHQDEKECYMHKPSPRRCHFVLPMKPSSLVAGQYLVHYESPGVHGYQSETFQGLKFRTIATIPEE